MSSHAEGVQTGTVAPYNMFYLKLWCFGQICFESLIATRRDKGKNGDSVLEYVKSINVQQKLNDTVVSWTHTPVTLHVLQRK